MNPSDRRRKIWKERKLNGLCIYCGKNTPKEDKCGCSICLEKKVKITVKFSSENKESMAQYRLLLKHQVLEKYGGKCACCGEKQILFLTIDHINNDGNKDRISIYGVKNAPSTSWYLKLRRESIRSDLQVLCFNCNMGKAMNCGVCPHSSIKRVLSPLYDKRHNPQFDKRLKIVWPNDDDLINMCNEKSVSYIAKKLGVDFTAISSRLKRRNKYHLIIKKHGGISIGEENPAAKLTNNDVVKIKELLESGLNRKFVAERFSVSKSTIDKIANNQYWKNSNLEKAVEASKKLKI